MMSHTNELVTRAVRQRTAGFAEPAELRVWLRGEVVRIELRAAGGPTIRFRPSGPHYDHILLDQIADRWSIETGQDFPCTWFEIDIHPPDTDSTCKPTARNGCSDGLTSW